MRDEKQGLKTARQSQCYILGLLVAFGMINEKYSGLRGAKGHWGPPRIRMQCRHIFTQMSYLYNLFAFPLGTRRDNPPYTKNGYFCVTIGRTL